MLADPATATKLEAIMAMPKGEARVRACQADPNIGRVMASKMTAALAATNEQTIFLSKEQKSQTKQLADEFSGTRKMRLHRAYQRDGPQGEPSHPAPQGMNIVRPQVFIVIRVIITGSSGPQGAQIKCQEQT